MPIHSWCGILYSTLSIIIFRSDVLYNTLQGIWPDCIKPLILKRNFIGCPPILNTRLDHNTWNYCDFPTLCKKHMSSLTFPANQYREGTGEGAYGLLSLSKKTTTSNHLQCHNKGSTFSWVILRRWVLVQSQARNSRPPMGIKAMCE